MPRILTALFAVSFAAAGAAYAQAVAATASPGAAEVRALPNHVPSWANEHNFIEGLPAQQAIGPMTMVLARRPDRQQAYEKLLADQQNPASPEYHHWLTPSEIGERFGLTTDELDALTGWLESQGLHVDWVSPARNFIGFSGSAGDMGRAFQTALNYYTVEGKRKISVASPPQLPADLAPKVKAIRGLYTIEDRPFSVARAARPVPEVTFAVGENYVTPADFATIYNLPSGLTGSGVTIGIVGRSRTDFDDFKYFEQATGTTFADPTEVIPPGGTDPGPAYTSPPASGTSIDDQLEATLDVFRAASIAQQAKVLLVVTKSTSTADISTDAQYLVQTEPVPAQIMNISFGACESEAGPSGVTFWDGLFSQAAMEGISVFVASGDAGASGCDSYFSTPPASPSPNSPNYICSSSYATCLGGTEFNDASDYQKYWNSSSNPAVASALSYIPEGAWNEPLNGNSAPQAAASGGGVSQVIATPSWQTGNGVPTARAGRYTPDIAFSASGHDGYFGCMAAIAVNSTQNAGCVPNSQGEYYFAYFEGTSAAAPDMAGIMALLDQKLGKGQGNLNPQLYPLAASAPSAFHDVTVATSGVSSCSVNTPSMCNNSIPGPSGLTGGQAGYAVGAGYDEVTGLGSLDVGNFVDRFAGSASLPVVTTGSASGETGATSTVAGTVNPEGSATDYWFIYGTSSSLSAAKKTAVASAGSGTSAVAVSVKLSGLAPLTKYYYKLQASSSAGTASGSVASFTTGKASQIISFPKPPGPVNYGAKITLSAKASSGLPVTFKVLSGQATVSGSTLTITGIETVYITAYQGGSARYLAAPKVTHSISVTKAQLTVQANNEHMSQGGKVPALAYTISGFVNGDTRAGATKGSPVLSTEATPNSKPGNYPIAISAGTLTAARYNLKLVNGTLKVNP